MIAGSLVGIALVGVQEAIEARREARAVERFTLERLATEAQMLARGHSIESLVAEMFRSALAPFVEWTDHLRAGTGHESRTSRVLSAAVAEHGTVAKLRTMRPLLADLEVKSGSIEIAHLRSLADKMLAEGLTTDERLELARECLARYNSRS